MNIETFNTSYSPREKTKRMVVSMILQKLILCSYTSHEQYKHWVLNEWKKHLNNFYWSWKRNETTWLFCKGHRVFVKDLLTKCGKEFFTFWKQHWYYDLMQYSWRIGVEYFMIFTYITRKYNNWVIYLILLIFKILSS